MIAADSSSVIAYLEGGDSEDAAKIDRALVDGTLVLPPPVVSELLSKSTSSQLARLLDILPTLPLTHGYWERAGRTRRRLIDQSLKAKFADALIAQCCIDADVALITRDSDYRHFETHWGLKLA